MDALIPVFLADYGALKGLALLALGLIVYLYWLSFREKREQRRQRRWLEARRRELKDKPTVKSELPPKV